MPPTATGCWIGRLPPYGKVADGSLNFWPPAASKRDDGSPSTALRRDFRYPSSGPHSSPMGGPAPLEFELVINLRVQKRSSWVPPTLRAHAEEVIGWSGALCCSMALRTTVAPQLCKRSVDVDARKDSMDAVRAYVEYGWNLNP